MATTDYDRVAPTYDQRYERNRYAGIEDTLRVFAGQAPRRILEVGCGSGHWLASLAASGHRVVGMEPSPGMLAKAKSKHLPAQLVRGHAEALPFEAGGFERVVMVNALHHFSDVRRAMREARRVLSSDGTLLTIGLDPTSDQDSWCIYDYFPTTQQRDRERFPATAEIRSWLLEAGFARSHSFVAERIEIDQPAREALAGGALARQSTSQLSELSDEAYAAGLAAIETAATAAEAHGETLRLRARLHLFGTIGMVEGGRYE